MKEKNGIAQKEFEELVITAGATLFNFKHPDRNEDTFFVSNNKLVFGVFDGLGGYLCGEVASLVVKEEIAKQVAAGKDILNALKKAQEVLWQERKTSFERQLMDTTALVVAIRELKLPGVDIWMANFVNVGDSRLYLLREGELKLLTPDERIKKAIKKRLISKAEAQALNDFDSWEDYEKLSLAAKSLLIYRSFVPTTMASFQKLVPQTETLVPGDLLLAVTDGVSDNLTEKEIRECLDWRNISEEKARMLVKKAYEKSLLSKEETFGHPFNPRAKPDDLTAIVSVFRG